MPAVSIRAGKAIDSGDRGGVIERRLAPGEVLRPTADVRL